MLYAAGCLLVPASSGALDLYLTLGMAIGLGLSSTTYVVLLGAVAQVVPPENRSTAFGIVTAVGSFGTFALVPGVQWADFARRLASDFSAHRRPARGNRPAGLWIPAPPRCSG